jgi:Spermine/spermidine synthase domain
MDYSFPRYLLAKQSVDDRALNKDVLATLKARLPGNPLKIIEVGGGIGTMLARLLRWKLISQAEYTLVDEMRENIEFSRAWLPGWAKENGLKIGEAGQNELQIFDAQRNLRVKLVQADVFDFIAQKPEPADVLIAHAFLDLLPMPEGLYKLFALTKGLAWMTLNFDGVTSLEPVIDSDLDARIERLYHETMDTRPGGGDSLSGRHLFNYLEQAGVEILSAGGSDWVVYPVHGRYPADEAYFLRFILHFIEESLGNHPEMDPSAFADWLGERRLQVERGELVYIAHQMDFLCRVPSPRESG